MLLRHDDVRPKAVTRLGILVLRGTELDFAPKALSCRGSRWRAAAEALRPHRPIAGIKFPTTPAIPQ